jgi:hypothetical protein
MKKISFMIRLLAALTLISAGAIHTFPYLWIKWDELITNVPFMHNLIGITAFLLGMISLILLFYEFNKN